MCQGQDRSAAFSENFSPRKDEQILTLIPIGGERERRVCNVLHRHQVVTVVHRVRGHRVMAPMVALPLFFRWFRWQFETNPRTPCAVTDLPPTRAALSLCAKHIIVKLGHRDCRSLPIAFSLPPMLLLQARRSGHRNNSVTSTSSTSKILDARGRSDGPRAVARHGGGRARECGLCLSLACMLRNYSSGIKLDK
jgi:hypothetical protein